VPSEKKPDRQAEHGLPAGKELGVDLALSKTDIRSAVEPQARGREDEISPEAGCVLPVASTNRELPEKIRHPGLWGKELGSWSRTSGRSDDDSDRRAIVFSTLSEGQRGRKTFLSYVRANEGEGRGGVALVGRQFQGSRVPAGCRRPRPALPLGNVRASPEQRIQGPPITL